MASVLRSAAGAVRRHALSLGQASQLQQTRGGAHDLHVKNNPYIESWLNRRNNIDAEFEWTTSNSIWGTVMCFGIPAAIYAGLVHYAHQDDDFAGRPRRDFLWAHGNDS